MARGAELSGVSLRAEDGEEVLERVAQPLAVVVFELVDDFEKGAQSLGVAVGQVGVVEDVAEEGRDTGVFRHPGNGLGVEVQSFVAAQPGAHQSRPAVTGEIVGEEGPHTAELFALGVDIVHEFVDEGDGDLFDLAFGVGHLAHEDVTGSVDTALGGGVEHGISFKELSTKVTKDTKVEDGFSSCLFVPLVDQFTNRFHSNFPWLPKLIRTPTFKPVAFR